MRVKGGIDLEAAGISDPGGPSAGNPGKVCGVQGTLRPALGRSFVSAVAEHTVLFVFPPKSQTIQAISRI